MTETSDGDADGTRIIDGEGSPPTCATTWPHMSRRLKRRA